MTVHELAKRGGVLPHVVRYYTQRGLLRPARNSRNRYREYGEYGESELYRLRFIRRAKTVGFTLSDIQLILRDADGGLAPCPEVRRILQARATENEQRVTEAAVLQRQIREAVEAWETMPDQNPDHQSLCRLIDAVALAPAP